MSTLSRLIKGAVFGLASVSLLTLASLNSQAQVPAKRSEPKAKILVGKEAVPARTEVGQQTARPPQPLSLEEKRRHFRSIITSLAEQSKLNPGQNSGQAFSPGVWNLNFDVLPSPPTLTPRQPLIAKVAWLDFSGPEHVGKKGVGEGYYADWHSTCGATKLLTLNLNAAMGTYLLDFTVDVEPEGLKIVEGAPASVSMQIPVAQGHVLVPLSAPKAGWYEIQVSCPGCIGWTFYSVEIDQVK